jgi:hypothetical protein
VYHFLQVQSFGPKLVRITAGYVEFYKDIKDEHICVYTLRKKHSLNLSVNSYKHADERENLSVWPTV